MDSGGKLIMECILETNAATASCTVGLRTCFTSLLLLSYEDVVYRFAGIAVTLGEAAMLLWLLIRGAKDQPLKAVA